MQECKRQVLQKYSTCQHCTHCTVRVKHCRLVLFCQNASSSLIFRMFRLHVGQILLSASSTLVSLLIAFLIRTHRSSIESYSDRYINEFEKAFKAIQYIYSQKTGKLPPDSTTKNNNAQKIRQFRCFFKPKPKPNFQAIYWQTVANAEYETFLYSAYYDNRQIPWFHESKGIIQILGMVKEHATQRLYCQMKFSKGRWYVVEAQVREIWLRHWDPRTRFYVPVLISCPLTSADVPNVVSVSFQPCSTPSNEFFISPLLDQPKMHTVICVKGMDFLDDISVRLAEWIEANLLFGADRIVIYTYAVHPNVAKILEYYDEKGDVIAIPLTLPGNMPNIPQYRSSFIQRNRQQKRRNELIPYNDCLYRLGLFQYLNIRESF